MDIQQAIIDQAIDHWRVRPTACIPERGADILNVILLYCFGITMFVCVFATMFYLDVRDNNDGVQAYTTQLTLAYVCCISQKALFRYPSRDTDEHDVFVANLSGYMCAKNYHNTIWFDRIIAKIKWCSFFDAQCRSAVCAYVFYDVDLKITNNVVGLGQNL